MVLGANRKARRARRAAQCSRDAARHRGAAEGRARRGLDRRGHLVALLRRADLALPLARPVDDLLALLGLVDLDAVEGRELALLLARALGLLLVLVLVALARVLLLRLVRVRGRGRGRVRVRVRVRVRG